MQATHPAIFALKNSGLEPFLYAEIGAGLNGSALTTLSMIAQLDQDPWAEAARWAALPRAAAIEAIAQSIAQMPLVPSALAEVRVIAARLAQLLPTTASGVRPDGAAKGAVPPMREWLPATLLYCAVAFGMAVSALLMPKPSQAVATPAGQSAAVAGTAAAALPVHDGPVVRQ